VKVVALTETAQKRLRFGRAHRLQRQQSIQPKYGVVQIAAAGPGFERAVGGDLPKEECLYEIDRFTQERGSQSGDLQHFQPYTHGPLMNGKGRPREPESRSSVLPHPPTPP